MGIVLLLVGSVAGGLYTTPMSVVKTGWAFETTWFLYSLLACVVFPWAVAFATVPNLLNVYSQVAGKDLALCALFGFLWGVGCQLFGIGVTMVGNSLGFALILGLCATLGSLIPLIALHPEQIATTEGLWNFVGVGLAVLALAAVATAGIQKERDTTAARDACRLVEGDTAGDAAEGVDGENPEKRVDASFSQGILVCVLSGVFSACLNLATAYGQSIADAAEAGGASHALATNAVFAISIGAGSIPNLAWCGRAIVVKKLYPCEHGGRAFAKALAMTAFMGVLWFGSNLIYGIAISMLPEDMGAVVGWPIFINGQIFVASFSGIATGEWKAAGSTAKSWMAVGLFVLCLAIIAVGIAGS